MNEKHSKTKTSFYRRLYLAYLIDNGVNTVPQIMEATGMPRRTAQDTIVAMHELGLECVFSGGTRNGTYSIEDWGAINRDWVKGNLATITSVLGYPRASLKAPSPA